MDYLTKQGLRQITEELKYLKTQKRREIAERLREASHFGDLSENAEYAEAKDDQTALEARIGELENILRNARLAAPRRSSGRVEIGSAIVAQQGSRRFNFVLVGAEEADPQAKKISPESPLGRAVLGRKPGDKIIVKTPGGRRQYKIVKIR